MDEDFINSLYETAKLKVASAENETRRVAEESRRVSEAKRIKKKEYYEKARKYAQDFTARELLETALATLTSPFSIRGLNLPVTEGHDSTSDQLAVHMGLLIEAAFAGDFSAASRFENLYGHDSSAADYVSKEELEQIYMAAFIYCPESNSMDGDIFRKYEPGTQKIAEVLISKLQQGIKKSDPNSFFALALASIQGRGIDKDIKKAYKLLTIAVGLGHNDSEKLRQQMIEKYSILNLQSQEDVPAEEISSENQVSRVVAYTPIDANKKSPASTDLLQIEGENFPSPEQVAGNNEFQPSADIVNPERVCLAMMKEEPYCTIISVADGTVAEWLASLPWDCHLLYEGVFQRENNTVDRCLRLLESNGYPAKSGDLCSAPPHVAMDSLIIATYQLGFERGRLAG